MPKTKSIFILNSNKEIDHRFQEALVSHINILNLNPQDQLNIEILKIDAADVLSEQYIQTNIARADIIIPLISIDFFQNDFLLKFVQKANDYLNKIIVPLQIRSTTDWQDIPPFNKIQPFNSQHPPIDLQREQPSEAFLTDIARYIKGLLLGQTANNENIPTGHSRLAFISKGRILVILFGLVLATLIPSLLIHHYFSPIYEVFNNPLVFALPFLFIPLIIALLLPQLDRTKWQNIILVLAGLATTLYALVFNQFCVWAMYYNSYLVKSYTFQERIIEGSQTQLDPRILINKYNNPALIWKYLPEMEILVFFSNLTFKIFLGLAIYVLVQRIWFFSGYGGGNTTQ